MRERNKMISSTAPPNISPTPPTAKWSGKERNKKKQKKMPHFGKGKKIGERNQRKMTDFGREKLEMASLQSRFDRKGKR